jgi:hypothetical protein
MCLACTNTTNLEYSSVLRCDAVMWAVLDISTYHSATDGNKDCTILWIGRNCLLILVSHPRRHASAAMLPWQPQTLDYISSSFVSRLHITFSKRTKQTHQQSWCSPVEAAWHGMWGHALSAAWAEGGVMQCAIFPPKQQKRFNKHHIQVYNFTHNKYLLQTSEEILVTHCFTTAINSD